MSSKDCKKPRPMVVFAISFPIPIVLREELAGEPEHYDWEKLPFYMLFNEELLDDAKLKDMQVSLKQKLSRKEEEIDHRRQEQDKYAGLLGVLKIRL